MMKSELKRALILVEFYKIRKKKLSDLSNAKLGRNKFRIFQTVPDNNFGNVSMTVVIFIAFLILKSTRKKNNNVLPL